MTWVDLVILAVLLISGLLAFLRGFVREVLGIGAWIGAALAGAWGLPFLREPLHRWVGPAWVDLVGFVIVFLVALIVLMIIARVVGGVVRGSPLGGVDRTLGLLFGLARGAALVIVAYIVAGMVVPIDQWPTPVREARALSPAYAGASWAVHQLPQDYRPRLYAPPGGRPADAEALLRATPQGRAVGK